MKTLHTHMMEARNQRLTGANHLMNNLICNLGNLILPSHIYQFDLEYRNFCAPYLNEDRRYYIECLYLDTLDLNLVACTNKALY